MAFVSQDLLISSNRVLELSHFSRERQRKCTCAAGLGVGGAGKAEGPSWVEAALGIASPFPLIPLSEGHGTEHFK